MKSAMLHMHRSNIATMHNKIFETEKWPVFEQNVQKLKGYLNRCEIELLHKIYSIMGNPNHCRFANQVKWFNSICFANTALTLFRII